MTHSAPPKWQIIAAFAVVYVIWGSTYLGIRFAIETIPPFIMAGVRFLIAGSLLFVLVRLRGAKMPNLIQWRSAAIIGGLLLVGGNGGVTWAEQTVPSGIAALLVALVPVWVVVVDWVRPGGNRPTGVVIFGLLMGLAGMVLLVGPGNIAGNNHINLVGALALCAASLLWAIGSVFSRHAQLPEHPLLATAAEMLCGGVLLIIASVISGEWAHVDKITGQWVYFNPSAISTSSLLAVAYLIVFGAMIAYSAYVWLLKVTTPARASTYAYVNPVVAVFLGWLLASEPLTPRTIIAAGIIIAAVIVITTNRAKVVIEAAGEPSEGPIAKADTYIEDANPAK